MLSGSLVGVAVVLRHKERRLPAVVCVLLAVGIAVGGGLLLGGVGSPVEASEFDVNDLPLCGQAVPSRTVTINFEWQPSTVTQIHPYTNIGVAGQVDTGQSFGKDENGLINLYADQFGQAQFSTIGSAMISIGFVIDEQALLNANPSYTHIGVFFLSGTQWEAYGSNNSHIREVGLFEFGLFTAPNTNIVNDEFHIKLVACTSEATCQNTVLPTPTATFTPTPTATPLPPIGYAQVDCVDVTEAKGRIDTERDADQAATYPSGMILGYYEVQADTNDPNISNWYRVTQTQVLHNGQSVHIWVAENDGTINILNIYNPAPTLPPTTPHPNSGCIGMSIPTSTPIPTATPTMPPLPPGAQGVMHVTCYTNILISIGPDYYANARNMPSLSGQIVTQILSGTTLYWYQQQGNWKRVSDYGAYLGSTLWMKDEGNDNDGTDSDGDGLDTDGVLVPGYATLCAQNTLPPPVNVTPYPTSTLHPAFTPVPPGCTLGGSCVNPTWTDDVIIAWVLACESGNDLQQATDIAYVVRARMQAGAFPTQAIDVITQFGQWDCYDAGAQPGTNPNSNMALSLAQALINGTALPTPSHPDIEHALYTQGHGIYAARPEQSQVISDLSFCNPPSYTLSEIYIYHSDINSAGFITVYFGDFPNC